MSTDTSTQAPVGASSAGASASTSGHASTDSGLRRTLLALLASALGVFPLKALLTDWGWLVDVWLTMAIVIAPAVLLRRRRPPGAFDVWPGIVALIPWLTARFVPTHAFAGCLPTRATWHDLSLLMTDLHHTSADERAPVHSTVAVRLVVCALFGLLAALVDLVAVVGRRGALAGVPLLVVYTVSGAVPRHPVNWVWFAVTAAAFLILLLLDAEDELRKWGRRISKPGSTRSRLTVPASAQRVGVLAIAVAVLVPLLLPTQSRNLIADALHRSSGDGTGNGSGSGGSISPYVSLRGELDHDSATSLMSVHVRRAKGAARTPFYARVNVLDTFTGSGWRVSDHGQTHGVNDSVLGVDEPNETLKASSYAARMTIFGMTGNAPVFATPDGITGLPSSTEWSSRDQVLLGTGVHSGMQYTETFTEANPSLAELRAANFVSYPGLRRYLTMPALPPSVQALVNRLTRGLTRPYARARAISNFFTDPADGFTYSLRTQAGDSGNDLVDFLKNRTGYCQQYAGAMAAMLRQAGVPTRVVLGYMHPAPDEHGDFVVTSFDAHSWVEAFFDQVGWVPFDPTPVSGLDGGPSSDIAYAPHSYPSDAARDDPRARATNIASSPRTSVSVPPTTAAPIIATPHSSRSLSGVFTGAAVLGGLALLLTPALLRLTRRRRRLAAGRLGDPDPLWAELSDTAVDLGYVWSPARSPRQVAAWLARDAREPVALDALARAVEQRRYGDTTTSESADLTGELSRVTAQLRGARSGRIRLRARLWPASLGLGSRIRGAGRRAR